MKIGGKAEAARRTALRGALALGLAAGCVLGTAYPFVQALFREWIFSHSWAKPGADTGKIVGGFNLLLTWGLGIAIAWTVTSWAGRSPLRWPARAGWVCAGCACLALYLAWGANEFAYGAVGQGPGGKWTLSPSVLIERMHAAVESGGRQIGARVPRGIEQIFYWLAEAGMIVGIAGVLGCVWSYPRRMAVRCRRCRRRAQGIRGIRRLSIHASESVERARSGSTEALAAAAPWVEGDRDYYRLDLATCEKCELHYLSVEKFEQGTIDSVIRGMQIPLTSVASVRGASRPS